MNLLAFQILLPIILVNLLTFKLSFAHDEPSSSASAGCSLDKLPDGVQTDEMTLVTINVTDSRLNESVIEREFYIRVPGTNGKPHSTEATDMKSLMIFFHGFLRNVVEIATKYEYNVMGRMEDVIMIYPEGMTDFYYPNGTQERGLQGWNAQGSAENTATGCYLGYHQCGYDICQKLGQCHDCAFTSCHNDVLFVQKILEWVFANLCVDTSRVFASGESNGGMMTYELMSRYSDPFNAFIVIYGVPLVGFLNFSDPGVVGKSLLHIHGFDDVWVPYNGTLSLQGLIFTRVDDVIEEYARIQNCSLDSIAWETPFDTVNDFECKEYPNCQSGATVVLCTYDGDHNHPPMVEETTYLFIDWVKIRADDKLTGFKTVLKSSLYVIAVLQLVLSLLI